MRSVLWTGKIEVRDDVETRPPGLREVQVRIHRAGLCHSDVSVVNGTIPVPPPVVMGHEGAGVVERVGDAVAQVKVGDHVVLVTLGHCGRCDACERGFPTHCRFPTGWTDRRFTAGGEAILPFANLGVFSETVVVQENQAVVIDKAVPMEAAALVSCAVITGAGAVLNRAQVRLGSTVVVIGAGGIGQSAIQAARLSGAERIIVVDANPAKEAAARQFGATDFVDASGGADTVAAVHELVPAGVDYALECVGHPRLIRQAFEMLGVGGCCVVVGTSPPGSEFTIPVFAINMDKSIIGCRAGGVRPHHDIPLITRLYLDGKFLLDEMVTAVYDLGQIETAMRDLEAGVLNRGVFSLT
jgi:S-(hydroxymethyl)glutathione dehydrogenase/alcohol dehydrogenase